MKGIHSSIVGTRGTDSGRLVAMATAQPAFNMATAASVAATTTATTASPSDLVGGVVGGGGGSGGGGNQQGQQGVSAAATVTVVTSPPSQQQQQQASQQAIVSANSVSITAVTHQTLQQNGSVDGSLDSPGDSSNGGGTSNGSTAQVTAQVVVSSDTAAVNAGSSEQNGSGGANQTAAGTTAIVGSPHYITVTVTEPDAVGSDTVAAQGVPPTYVQYVEGSADQAIYAATNGQMSYPVYTVGETGTMYTPASGQYYSGNTTAVTYSQQQYVITRQPETYQDSCTVITFSRFTVDTFANMHALQEKKFPTWTLQCLGASKLFDSTNRFVSHTA
jgi:regulatory factor X 1/2/3